MKRAPLGEITSLYERKSNIQTAENTNLFNEEWNRNFFNKNTFNASEVSAATQDQKAEIHKDMPLQINVNASITIPQISDSAPSRSIINSNLKKKTKALLRHTTKSIFRSRYDHQIRYPNELAKKRVSNKTHENLPQKLAAKSSFFVKPDCAPFEIFNETACVQKGAQAMVVENEKKEILMQTPVREPLKPGRCITNLTSYCNETSIKIGNIVINFNQENVLASKENLKTLKVIL